MPSLFTKIKQKKSETKIHAVFLYRNQAKNLIHARFFSEIKQKKI